jgi:hypothetical protein
MTLLFMLFVTAKESMAINRDFVPDAKTAVRIAEAVLVGQYGQERVNAQLPLMVNMRLMVVESTLRDKEGNYMPGRGLTVMIHPQIGCLSVYR